MGLIYTQVGVADSVTSDLTAGAGVKGYLAYAKDTNQFYGHNGTLWVPQAQLAGPLGLVMGPDASIASNRPTLSVNTTVAGPGATATIDGNNISGTITLVTGTAITVGGIVMTLTLANGASFPNKMKLVFSGGDSNFAGILTKLYTTHTTNVATLYVYGLAMGVSTTYTGNYTISGW